MSKYRVHSKPVEIVIAASPESKLALEILNREEKHQQKVEKKESGFPGWFASKLIARAA